jgi:FlaA1/EpsC-like NDP-sugar epimerase
MNNKLEIIRNDHFLNDVVLITGAGGTIGSELVRRISAKTIVAVDISEYAVYKLQREITTKNIHCVVGDVSDRKLVELLFRKYSFDYVFNAAAYKHVDTLEDENNTYSVVKNNALSTINLCELANRYNIKQLIHISSDKAVNPTNNMGYTKLWCERIVQHYSKSSNTNFKIVRFGNVYNSAGSFVETLAWQLAVGKPITITDNRMMRYFLTISDAVSLILDIVNFAEKNKTYILNMGEEISIIDLVKQLNTKNAPVEYIGVRPGEKLREELYYDYEILASTENPMIFSVEWKKVDMLTNINVLLKELKEDNICLTKLNEIITTTTIL